MYANTRMFIRKTLICLYLYTTTLQHISEALYNNSTEKDAKYHVNLMTACQSRNSINEQFSTCNLNHVSNVNFDLTR